MVGILRIPPELLQEYVGEFKELTQCPMNTICVESYTFIMNTSLLISLIKTTSGGFMIVLLLVPPYERSPQ